MTISHCIQQTRFALGLNESYLKQYADKYQIPFNEPSVNLSGQVKYALPNITKLYVDGEEFELFSYNIDGAVYFKLIDLAKALDLDIDSNATDILIQIDESDTSD